MVLEIVEVAMVTVVAAVVAVGPLTLVILVMSTTFSYMWGTLGGDQVMVCLCLSYGG